ncbi:MAG: kelch repeat-containing protein [Minicystis sp.]
MPPSSSQARLSSSIRPLVLVAVLAAGGTGVAACADSLHLDPAGTGGKDGGATSTGTHGTGGHPATHCDSNPECSYPTPVCDTVAHACVECLTFTDCDGPKPGTVCSLGACVCPASTDTTPLTYCPDPNGAAGRCIDTQTAQTDCGGCGKACFGSCAAGKCADPWRPTATAGAPTARRRHVAVSTDPKSATAKMIVRGGRTAAGLTNTGGIYDPATDTWTQTSIVNAPAAREDATAVWDDTEKELIVWGGRGTNGLLNTGGRYNPATNTWKSLSTGSAPAARVEHSAVFAKTASFMGATHGMIVFGGFDGSNPLADGWLYDPVKDAWLGPIDSNPAVPTAPTLRKQHKAVWADTTNVMLVWGGLGLDGMGGDSYLFDGAFFDPSLAGTPTAWTPLDTSNAPSARARHTAVWDGTSMIVWGGFSGQLGYLSSGGRFDLVSKAWTPTGTSPAPEGRDNHTAVWLDGPKQMIIFGGQGQSTPYLDTGWSLDATLTWKALPIAPEARVLHTAVPAGTTMIVWGGEGFGGLLNSGAIYDAAP